MRRPAALLLAIAAAGCASSAPPASAALALSFELSTAPLDGPAPSDAAPAVAVTVREGATERLLPGRHVGAIRFDDAVVALGTDGALRRFEVDAELTETVIAQAVTSLPVVSRDGAHLSYVVSADGLTGALHVLDAMGDRVITPALGSIGALAFSPDGARVAFVGVGARGGIAGVWIADARDLEPARCLTNCALAPGELDRAVPLPATGLRVEHQRIAWTDAEGVEREVSF